MQKSFIIGQSPPAPWVTAAMHSSKFKYRVGSLTKTKPGVWGFVSRFGFI